jgi:hypothetical protein
LRFAGYSRTDKMNEEARVMKYNTRREDRGHVDEEVREQRLTITSPARLQGSPQACAGSCEYDVPIEVLPG